MRSIIRAIRVVALCCLTLAACYPDVGGDDLFPVGLPDRNDDPQRADAGPGGAETMSAPLPVPAVTDGGSPMDDDGGVMDDGGGADGGADATAIDASVGAARPPPPCGILGVNGVLYTNQLVTSCDKRFTLIMQGDGNLVLYKNGGIPIPLFHTGTFDTPSNRAIMQADGNFVVYDTANVARFHTRTFNNPGATLAVQNDGNLVVYSINRVPLWSSGTAGR